MGKVVSPNLSISFLKKKDAASYTGLFREVFKKSIEESYFYWKYFEENGVDHQSLVTGAWTEDGRLVGVRSYLATIVRAHGTDYRVVQSCDTMVHPDFRRQGLATRMAQAALPELEKQDIDFIFNFPNRMSWPGYEKMGWEKISDVYVMVHLINMSGILQTKSRLPDPLKTLVSRFLSIPAAVVQSVTFGKKTHTAEQTSGFTGDDLERINRTLEKKVHQRRSKKWFEWRYVRKPDKDYRFIVCRDKKGTAAGYAVIGVNKVEQLVIAEIHELITLPDNEEKKLVIAIVEWAKSQHFDMVRTWVATKQKENLFRKLLFHRRDTELKFVQRSIHREPDRHPEAVKDPSNWYLMMGDSDAH